MHETAIFPLPLLNLTSPSCHSDFLKGAKISTIRVHLRQIYNYLIFSWVLRTSWLKMVFGGQNRGRAVRYWPPNELVFPLGVLTSVPILVKIDQEMRPWGCYQTDSHTNTLTDWLTDANRFSQPVRIARNAERCNSQRDSVCASIRLSVTFRYCVQTNEDTNVRFPASGSTIPLVCGEVKFIRILAVDHPSGDIKARHPSIDCESLTNNRP